MAKSHRKGYKLIWTFDINHFKEMTCLLGWEMYAKGLNNSF